MGKRRAVVWLTITSAKRALLSAVAVMPAANVFRAAQATRLPLQKRAAIANRHSAISSQQSAVSFLLSDS
jgi:hypothetical protein